MAAVNNIIRGGVIIGVVLALLIGVGLNYFYVYKVLNDLELAWFISMLMYTIVMLLQSIYILHNETTRYQKNDLKLHLAWGNVVFFCISVLSVICGFTFFHSGIIYVALMVLAIPVLLFFVKILFIR